MFVGKNRSHEWVSATLRVGSFACCKQWFLVEDNISFWANGRWRELSLEEAIRREIIHMTVCMVP